MCSKELQLHNFIKFFAYVNEILTGMGRNSATPGIGSDREPTHDPGVSKFVSEIVRRFRNTPYHFCGSYVARYLNWTILTPKI